jgi:hypothetical protein
MDWPTESSSLPICPASSKSLPEESGLALFKLKQVSFRFQSAGESGEFAGDADDSVTWNHDADRVSTIGGPHSSRSTWLAKLSCKLTVRASLPEGDAA